MSSVILDQCPEIEWEKTSFEGSRNFYSDYMNGYNGRDEHGNVWMMTANGVHIVLIVCSGVDRKAFVGSTHNECWDKYLKDNAG